MKIMSDNFSGAPTTITLHVCQTVFDIFVFFFQVAPHIMSLYYHDQTVIICLNQIDTPPAAFLAEFQKS